MQLTAYDNIVLFFSIIVPWIKTFDECWAKETGKCDITIHILNQMRMLIGIWHLPSISTYFTLLLFRWCFCSFTGAPFSASISSISYMSISYGNLPLAHVSIRFDLLKHLFLEIHLDSDVRYQFETFINFRNSYNYIRLGTMNESHSKYHLWFLLKVHF